MSLEVIYVTRHGFRSNWVVSPDGVYSASIKSPTGIASDPALAGYGVDQANQLASHLVKLSPPIERFYSSPFYRCIQTLNPTLDLLSSSSPDHKIRGENGIGEWYGMARFDHPSPAEPELLNQLFPRYDLRYSPVIKPSVNGETIDQLHDRTAYTLHRIIEQSDREGVKAILICTHAATLIAIGRSLTGRMPVNIEEEDFHPFTCGLSTFVRRESPAARPDIRFWEGPNDAIPDVEWRDGKGVGGGWECKISGDCSFLSGGEERGWRFSGDESFSTTAGKTEGQILDAGSELGVVIEGKKKESPSRL